ncbi:hypothetical protein RO3G_04255 [Rhizopus delemar RA 99-880]|uniref:Uncharacterized protein n=1 Tax=Rhizopus delemar (strain RA 99-880 / ATCC MYA-4621 / FGSC 9543 / NRRL 43880) TaxID=246409 RepID=I1BTM0_RHIO9|nr:hypothetical protein RO3G_04255 [Rhizopus delemar RA 99-880]|eukprot:EIE79550.1 hypothetical protein RO3G_04255 [Rhizopus delemar RA 99-880]
MPLKSVAGWDDDLLELVSSKEEWELKLSKEAIYKKVVVQVLGSLLLINGLRSILIQTQ